MSIKITASGERLFRLRGCSEDDTIFIGNKWHSSECYFETYWRMFHRSTVPVGAGAVFFIYYLMRLLFL